LTPQGSPLTTIHYDKRLNDFGKRIKKKYVKTTIIVDDKSQIVVVFDIYFGEIHDSKEFKKTLENMDREIINKFKIIIGDKGYDSEENFIIAKKPLCNNILRNEDILMHIEQNGKTERG